MAICAGKIIQLKLFTSDDDDDKTGDVEDEGADDDDGDVDEAYDVKNGD